MSKVFNCRVNEDELKIFQETSKKLNLNFSEFVLQCMRSFCNTNIHIIDKKNVYDGKIKKSLKIATSELRDTMSFMYFKRNAIKRLMNICFDDMLTINHINEHKIKKVLGGIKSVYTSYPKEIQDLLKEDYDFIMQFKNMEVLGDFSKNYMRLLSWENKK